MKIKFALLAAALVSLSSGANGQTSDATIEIGGLASLGSEFDFPGRLNDEVTLGEAIYDFHLDVGASTLSVTVFNTSPVLFEVCNPIILGIYFNAPEVQSPGGVGITDMTLFSTTWGAGSLGMPDFTLFFDGDSSDGFSGEQKADGFGYFNVAVLSGSISNGGISNPAADTLIMPDAHGYAPTFLFSLTGNLLGLTAEDFTNLLSHPPPGERNQFGVAKFQAGGADCNASGFISNENPKLYVELDFFRGSQIGGGILLGWRTLAEIDNVGFNVYRQPVTAGPHGRVTGEAVKLNTSLIAAQGDPITGATYTLATRSTSGRSIYWLEDIDIHGASTWHGPITIGSQR